MDLDRDDKPLDILDLIINQLREHERKIDMIGERLESIAELDVLSHRPRHLSESVYLRITMKKWGDFKRRCENAELLSFLVDKKNLKIMARIGNNLNVYYEMLPEVNILCKTDDNILHLEVNEINNLGHFIKAFRGELECGLRLKTEVIEVKNRDEVPTRIIFYSTSSKDVKRWLCNEMSVDPSFVIEGEMSKDY